MLKRQFVLEHPTHMCWSTIDSCFYNKRCDSLHSEDALNNKSNEIVDILPLSKLALHAEGVPLILPNNAIIKNSNTFNNYFVSKEEDKSKLFGLNSIVLKNEKRNSECLFKGNDLFLSDRTNHIWRSNTSNLNKDKLISSLNSDRLSITTRINDDEVSVKNNLLLNCNIEEVSICSFESRALSVNEITANIDINSIESQTETKTLNKGNCSDNLSITSEDSSSASEHSLPRVIKPRKRRKKDKYSNRIIPLISLKSIKIPISDHKSEFVLPESSFAIKTLTTEVEHFKSKCNKLFYLYQLSLKKYTMRITLSGLSVFLKGGSSFASNGALNKVFFLKFEEKIESLTFLLHPLSREEKI